MRFLKSIRLGSSSKRTATKIKNLEKQVSELRAENEKLNAAVEEIVVCLNQVTATTAALVTQLTMVSRFSNSSEDAVDEMLDSLWKKDDDGSGYLN